MKEDSEPKLETLPLTAKEELAIIVQRLKKHEREATDPRCKVRLDIAADLVNMAIHSR